MTTTRGSNPLASYLQPDQRLSSKANEVLRREHQRIVSCGNLFHENGFILEQAGTGKIKDVGRIACKSRWCNKSCLTRKEIEQRERLEATLNGFEAEFSDSVIGLLTTNLPPLNEKLSLYEIDAIDEYKVEAEFRRDVRDLFTTHLNGSLSCSFVRGWFRSEEQTISAEKYYKGRVVKGNNLNLHFHNILLMSCVPEEIQDEFQLSCYFYMKWFRCYRQACKQRGIKPKPLKPPYRDDNGVIRGSVVFLFKRSLTDDQGNDSLASYVIKKAAWGLSAEATAKSRKNESKGLNMQSIVESKRATCFKANAVKMLVVVNHGQREYEYSKMKEGPVHKPKKTKKPRKTPEEMMHISLKKYENGGAANLKVRASACKKKNTKPISKKSDESKKCKKGLGNRYINKKSNQEKENERRRWRPYAAVNHSEYYKVGEADLIKDDVERLFEEFVKESSEAREKGRKKRKNKVKFEKGETILAS